MRRRTLLAALAGAAALSGCIESPRAGRAGSTENAPASTTSASGDGTATDDGSSADTGTATETDGNDGESPDATETAHSTETAEPTDSPESTDSPEPTDSPTPTATPEPETTVETNATTASGEPKLEVPSAAEVPIEGGSTRPSGTELEVRLTNDGSSPFLKQRSATVSADGNWSATFDFSRVDTGTTFEIEVNLAETGETVARLEHAEVVEE